jgi:mono/diheme cytochrome c family protein
MATRHANFAVPSVATFIAACLLLPVSVLGADPVTKSAESGAMLFHEHCAGCHGADATGDGPAAPAMTTPPPNLTEITKRAGGMFPAARVVEIITYGGNIAAHGSAPMPVWGKVFSVEGGRGKVGSYYSRRAGIALKRYLQSIQK